MPGCLRNTTVENPAGAQIDSGTQSSTLTGCFQLGLGTRLAGPAGRPWWETLPFPLLVSRPHLCEDSRLLHAHFLKILVA